MLEIGTSAPDFSLPAPANGTVYTRSQFSAQPLLIVFSCNHCPYVLHILESFAGVANDAQARGVAVAMINANDVANYADDSPEKMVQLGEKFGFEFPYLYDESQQTASAYQAACTPDFFLFDATHRLVYRGQYDDSRPGNSSPVNGKDLKAALQSLLAGEAIQAEQIPSVGCNIKWQAGREPSWF